MALFFEKDQIKQLKLPSNRWQSFFDCLLNKTSHTILIGLFIFIFSIPVLLVLGIANILVYDITLQLSGGIITQNEAATRIFDTLNAAYLLLIPALVILFMGLAGLVRVSRRMIHQEHVAFFSDFGTGFKSNALSFALTGLLLGVLYFAMMFLLRAGYFLADNNWYDITLSISIGALVLALMIAPFILIQTDLYNLPYLAKLKNAFLIGMRSAPTSLPMLLVIFSPWLLMLITFDSFVYFIVLALLFILVAPLQLIAINEYGLAILDKYINKTNHPEIYDKGIYRNAQN